MESEPRAERHSITIAVISAIAVILAAVIGAVIPNLNAKTKAVSDLNTELSRRQSEYSLLREKLGAGPGLEGKHWQISGTISPAPKGRFTVYLVPGNSLSTVTDSRGHFVLDDVPATSYHVVILDEVNSATDRLIEPNQPSDSFSFKNATVTWQVADAPKGPA